MVAPNGYSTRVRDTAQIEGLFGEARRAPESVGFLRLEFVQRGVGAIAVEYHTEVPGMVPHQPAIAATSARLGESCVKSLFQQSASVGVSDHFGELVEY